MEIAFSAAVAIGIVCAVASFAISIKQYGGVRLPIACSGLCALLAAGVEILWWKAETPALLSLGFVLALASFLAASWSVRSRRDADLEAFHRKYADVKRKAGRR